MGSLRVSVKDICKRMKSMELNGGANRLDNMGGQKTTTKMPLHRDGIRSMIKFMNNKYLFRFNSVMGYTEYCRRGIGGEFMPLEARVMKRMAIEAQLEGFRVTFNDVRFFLESDLLGAYNPLKTFLDSCSGIWDGNDRIRQLANTVKCNNQHWGDWFYRWFLGMVSQWREQEATREYGNSTVPLLISRQGFNKSTFCRRLLPPELQWGYCDNLIMTEKKQVLQAMSQFLLINLDEFNQISAKVQQGFLKNLVQLPNVKTKRPYGGHVEEFPRLASFIATSNIDDVLFDPSGNRRFLGVELTGPIDVSRRPNYTQLFAQALAALDRGEKGYFDIDETKRIMDWNMLYRVEQPAEQCFSETFCITDDESRGVYLTAASIFQELKQKYGAGMVGNSLLSFGRKLRNINGIKFRRTSKGTEYLVVRM